MTTNLARLSAAWNPYGGDTGGSPVRNRVTRDGTRDSRQEFTVVADVRVPHVELRAVYNSYGLARKIVDTPPYEAMAVPPEYAAPLESIPDLNMFLVELVAVTRCFGVGYAAYNRGPNLDLNDGMEFSLFRPYLISEQEDTYETISMGRDAQRLTYNKDDILTVFSGVSATEACLLGDIWTTYPPQGTSKLEPLVWMFKAYGLTASACTEAILQHNALHAQHRGWNYGAYGDAGYKESIESHWEVPSGRSVIHGPDTDKYERLYTETDSYRDEMNALTERICTNSDVPYEKLVGSKEPGLMNDGSNMRDSWSVLIESIQNVEMSATLRWMAERKGYTGNEDPFEFQEALPEVREDGNDDGNDMPETDDDDA